MPKSTYNDHANWPGCGWWTALPRILGADPAAFGLDLEDLGLLVHMECLRREQRPVALSAKQIAKKVGRSESHINRLIKKLADAEKIEKHRRMKGGRFARNAYTRDGLVRAVAEGLAQRGAEEMADKDLDLIGAEDLR